MSKYEGKLEPPFSPVLTSHEEEVDINIFFFEVGGGALTNFYW